MVSDDGALESFSAMLITLLLLMALTFATAFALITQYQHGRTAADLAALAAVGSTDPCGAAQAVVRRNGAQLVECLPGASDVRITVAVPSGMRGLQLPTSIEVSARAGIPVSAGTPDSSTVTP